MQKGKDLNYTNNPNNVARVFADLLMLLLEYCARSNIIIPEFASI